MVTDEQVRLLRKKRMNTTLESAAAAAGMSERTARKWANGPLPSQTKRSRDWRTREDPFAEVWTSDIEPLLRSDEEGKLEAKTVMAELMRRVEIWTDEEIAARRLPKGSWRLLRETILVGEFPRSAAEELTGYQERQARTVISSLTARGLLVSDTPKGPVRLGIPAEVTERWFPGLYQPEPPAPPRPAVARKDDEDDTLGF